VCQIIRRFNFPAAGVPVQTGVSWNPRHHWKDAVFSNQAKTNPTLQDQHLFLIENQDKVGWRKETEYCRRSLVENAFFRYKRILGGHLRSRTDSSQKTEVHIGINILNQMNQMGRPQTIRI